MAGAMRWLMALAAAALTTPAGAAVEVGFYWHEGHGTFPHAFVATRGAMDADPAHPVAYNYGFTVRTLSPAVLARSVDGKIDVAAPRYVAQSVEAFRVTLSDARYRALVATVEKWRALPSPAYNLERRNCVHFTGDIARAIGLTVDEPAKLMKKPRLYLQHLRALNADRVTAP